MANSAPPDRGAAWRDDHVSDLLAPFLRLNFATLWVRDQDRSRQFFVDRLGFQPIVDAEVPGVGRWIVVVPPNGPTGLALVVPPQGSPESLRIGQNTGLSFLTEDVRALFDDWSTRGIHFTLPPIEPAWGSGQARYAIFQDVDGNSFSLIEFDEATRTLDEQRRAAAKKLEAERQAAHDLAMAKEVQSRLFPQQQPALRTLEYAGLCHSARAVGGDYYDFLDLGDGRLGLVIGDIVGKGMRAALLMANLQANLRSRCAIAWEQPARFLRSVNRLFYENTADRDYGTVIFAEYDDRTHQLRYANCGHPPALLLRSDGTLENLESTSTVLGLFAEWDCEIEERRLHPGDTLVLYTDGVTECSNHAGEEFGGERLLEVVRESRGLPAEQLAGAIADRVRQFSPQEQEQADDITLIVARCG